MPNQNWRASVWLIIENLNNIIILSAIFPSNDYLSTEWSIIFLIEMANTMSGNKMKYPIVYKILLPHEVPICIAIEYSKNNWKKMV